MKLPNDMETLFKTGTPCSIIVTKFLARSPLLLIKKVWKSQLRWQSLGNQADAGTISDLIHPLLSCNLLDSQKCPPNFLLHPWILARKGCHEPLQTKCLASWVDIVVRSDEVKARPDLRWAALVLFSFFHRYEAAVPIYPQGKMILCWYKRSHRHIRVCIYWSNPHNWIGLQTCISTLKITMNHT